MTEDLDVHSEMAVVAFSSSEMWSDDRRPFHKRPPARAAYQSLSVAIGSVGSFLTSIDQPAIFIERTPEDVRLDAQRNKLQTPNERKHPIKHEQFLVYMQFFGVLITCWLLLWGSLSLLFEGRFLAGRLFFGVSFFFGLSAFSALLFGH
ncbi:MAG TPA: hypothetical protein VLT36_17255 [Candidatus Dormibacteraeota bacterium]|nr:hypothetical protein [Candidatus Dormibacteraeota bacterium]